MSCVEIGQVLWMRVRYNNSGDIAKVQHPCLVVSVTDDFVEVAHGDSLIGKEYKAARKSNHIIYSDNPDETVFDRDGYIQLDNSIRLENFAELAYLRKTDDRLSSTKLNAALKAYNNYRNLYAIDENKMVYMDEEEIKDINF